MLKSVRSCALASIFVASFAVAASAQQPLQVVDPAIGMTTTIGGDVAWELDVDNAGGQSTVGLVHDDGDNLIAIQIMTMLQENPAALSDEPLRVQFTTQQFLEGLCDPFVCADTEGKAYLEIGDRMAYVLETQLGLRDYKRLGMTDTVMIATTTPQGYMQLISLHAAADQIDAYKDVVMDLAKNAVFE